MGATTRGCEPTKRSCHSTRSAEATESLRFPWDGRQVSHACRVAWAYGAARKSWFVCPDLAAFHQTAITPRIATRRDQAAAVAP